MEILMHFPVFQDRRGGWFVTLPFLSSSSHLHAMAKGLPRLFVKNVESAPMNPKKRGRQPGDVPYPIEYCKQMADL
jgi:hypothetical protein